MNQCVIRIDNCCDCPHSYTDRIWTADPFEHEVGLYCKQTEDKTSSEFGANGQHKLITFDDWDIRKSAQVPDWCPMKG